MAANSSFGASSSLESTGGGIASPGSGTTSIARREKLSGRLSQWVSRMASCAVPGSRITELRGRGSGMDEAGAIRMSTSPFGPELELVDVGLGLRARPPADLALAEGVPKVMPR